MKNIKLNNDDIYLHYYLKIIFLHMSALNFVRYTGY